VWLIEQLIGRLFGRGPRRAVHLAALGLLAFAFGVQVLKDLDVTSQGRILGLALLAAVLAVLVYRRWEFVRLWIAYLVVAPLFFVGLFLLSSPTSDLLASQEVTAADVPPATDPAPVVVLQFDEWPTQTLLDAEGQIDADLYPNLAELAGDGTWYRNATTAATYTSYAVPAMLTGRYPDGERTPIASQYPDNLFSLMAGQFDLDVIESLTELCPPNLCDDNLVDQDGSSPETPEVELVVPTGLGPLLTDARQTFQAMIDPDPFAVSPTVNFQDEVRAIPVDDPAGESVPLPPVMLSLDTVDRLVSSIEEDEDPTLHFLHILLPHTPYTFLPDGRRYGAELSGLVGGGPMVPTGRPTERAAVAFEEQRLLLQAGYTDTVVGRVLDRLRETGLYEDATVVVVADHGIGLEPGGTVRSPVGDEVPEANYPDLFYVPLIIKAPSLGSPGTVSDANVNTIDVLPTVAGSVGLELPWDVDGIDLATEERSDPEKQVAVVHIAPPSVGGRELSLDDPITFDGDVFLQEVLARNTSRLLYGDNPEHRLYDIDAAGEIVGDRVDDLEVRPAADVRATLADPDVYADVDTDGAVLPTHFVADLESPDTGPFTVAVAVNGRVAAVSPTWPAGDQPHHLEAMLVPDLLQDGRNQIDLYLVGGPEGRRHLIPIERTD